MVRALVPAGLSLFGVHLQSSELGAGEEIELYGELGVRPDFGTGKVSVQYERVFGNSSSGPKLDPIRRKLAPVSWNANQGRSSASERGKEEDKQPSFEETTYRLVVPRIRIRPESR